MNNLAVVRPLICHLDLHSKIVLRYASATWYRYSNCVWYWERNIQTLCKYTTLSSDNFEACRDTLLFCYLFKRHIETTWFFDMRQFYHPRLFYYYQLLVGLESERYSYFMAFNRLNRQLRAWYDERKNKLRVKPSKGDRNVIVVSFNEVLRVETVTYFLIGAFDIVFSRFDS
jgi:hypothetical protein